MPSLDETFAELQTRLVDPDLLNPTQADPFFYFVHDPAQTLAVKQKLGYWTAALEKDRWTVERISLSRVLWELVDASGRWEEWLSCEADADQAALNESIRGVLRDESAMARALEPHLATRRERTVVFLTDAVCLHPYFRARALESALQNRVQVPTVLFYPGRRSGPFGLHFLGFYPLDGNYRATLIGGVK